MGEIIIRAAKAEDFSNIRRLIHAVNINPTGLDWKRFLVAFSPANEFLGCGQIKPHRDGSIELASIAVQEHFRGRGVARAIIEKLLVGESRRPLYLMCRLRLVALYEKFGFRIIGRNEMPPYFQMISRAERIFNKSAESMDRLRVMRLD